MKIAFIIAGFAYGGAERVLCKLANDFADNGDEVSVVTLTYREPTYPLSKNIRVINGLQWKNYPDGVKRLRRQLLELKPDVAVSFLVQVNIVTCMALLGTGIPVIVSERNDPVRMPPERSRKILRRLFYPAAAGFVFQTEQAKAYFGKKIAVRSRVIPNPLFLDGAVPPVEERPHRVIAAGRLVPQKNHPMLIRAFAGAVDENSDWKLDIFGDGEDSDRAGLQGLIDSLRMTDRIILHPGSDAIHREMGESAVYVMTSDFEGMPNALMEAMGMGLACISTDCPCGGPAFLITPDKDGVLVPVGDTAALTAALEELMTREERRIALGNAAVSIRERLDSRRIFDEWNDYIKQIIS